LKRRLPFGEAAKAIFMTKSQADITCGMPVVPLARGCEWGLSLGETHVHISFRQEFYANAD